MKMRDNRLGVLVVSLLLAMPLASEEEQEVSMEFLEFLGEWENPDGSWQDPLPLMEEEAYEQPEEKDDEQ